MAINGKDVGKNVSADTSAGAFTRATPRAWWAIDNLAGSLSGLATTALCALALALATASQATSFSGLGDPVAWSHLPPEARQTEQRIHAGGPFAHAQDGAVFGNREGHLEQRPRGYYHEYTVPSPGARDRGARRIVCGGDKPTEPEACFYTEDHYSSFHRIVK